LFQRILSRHERRKKFFQGGQSRQFAHSFQVADEAMQMNVDKTLYPFYTTKKMPHCPMVRQQSQKCTSLAAMFLFHSCFFSHCIKLRAIGSHCLAALPAAATGVCVQQEGCQIFSVAYGQIPNKFFSKWLFFEKSMARNTKCLYGNLYSLTIRDSKCLFLYIFAEGSIFLPKRSLLCQKSKF